MGFDKRTKKQKHGGGFRVPGFICDRSADAPAIYQFFITEQIRTMEYFSILLADIMSCCGDVSEALLWPDLAIPGL